MAVRADTDSAGRRSHYDFVKPRQAFDGRTPAESGFVGGREDKWLSQAKAGLKGGTAP